MISGKKIRKTFFRDAPPAPTTLSDRVDHWHTWLKKQGVSRIDGEDPYQEIPFWYDDNSQFCFDEPVDEAAFILKWGKDD